MITEHVDPKAQSLVNGAASDHMNSIREVTKADEFAANGKYEQAYERMIQALDWARSGSQKERDARAIYESHYERVGVLRTRLVNGVTYVTCGIAGSIIYNVLKAIF